MVKQTKFRRIRAMFLAVIMLFGTFSPMAGVSAADSTTVTVNSYLGAEWLADNNAWGFHMGIDGTVAGMTEWEQYGGLIGTVGSEEVAVSVAPLVSTNQLYFYASLPEDVENGTLLTISGTGTHDNGQQIQLAKPVTLIKVTEGWQLVTTVTVTDFVEAPYFGDGNWYFHMKIDSSILNLTDWGEFSGMNCFDGTNELACTVSPLHTYNSLFFTVGMAEDITAGTELTISGTATSGSQSLHLATPITLIKTESGWELQQTTTVEPTVMEVNEIGVASWENGTWSIILNLAEQLPGIGEWPGTIQGMTYAINDGAFSPLYVEPPSGGKLSFSVELAENIAGTTLTIACDGWLQNWEGVHLIESLVFAEPVVLYGTSTGWSLEPETVVTDITVSGVEYSAWNANSEPNQWNVYLKLAEALQGVGAEEWVSFSGLTYSCGEATEQPLVVYAGVGTAEQLCIVPSSDFVPQDVTEGTILTINAGQALTSDESLGIKLSEPVALVKTSAAEGYWKVQESNANETTVLVNGFYETPCWSSDDGKWAFHMSIDGTIQNMDDWQTYSGLLCSDGTNEVEVGVAPLLTSNSLYFLAALPESVEEGTTVNISGTATYNDKQIHLTEPVTLVKTATGWDMITTVTVTGFVEQLAWGSSGWPLHMSIDGTVQNMDDWQTYSGLVCSDGVNEVEISVAPIHHFNSLYFNVDLPADVAVGTTLTISGVATREETHKQIRLTEPVVLVKMEDGWGMKTTLTVTGVNPLTNWSDGKWTIFLDIAEKLSDVRGGYAEYLAGLEYSINKGNATPVTIGIWTESCLVFEISYGENVTDIPLTINSGIANLYDDSTGAPLNRLFELVEPVTLVGTYDGSMYGWQLQQSGPVEEEDGYLGDPSKDGNRSAVDLVMMIKAISEPNKSPSLYKYDVNIDHVVDSNDVSYMRMVLVGEREIESFFYNSYGEIELAAFMGPPTSGGSYDDYNDENGYPDEFPGGHVHDNRNYLTLENFQDYKDAGFTYLLSEGSTYYPDKYSFPTSNMKTYMDLAQEVGLPVVAHSDLVEMMDKTLVENEWVARENATLSEGDKLYIDNMLDDLSQYGDIFKGITIKDEPTLEQAGILKSILDYAKLKKPNLYQFTCMLPTGGFKDSSGNIIQDDYKEYIGAMSNATGTFAADNYPLKIDPQKNETFVMSDYYLNYELIAQDAKANNYDSGVIVQSSSWGNYGQENTATHIRKTNKKADIGFQVYSALAYGAKYITYYTYWEHTYQYSGGFVYDAMVMFPSEAGGEPIKTDTYYAVQAVNEEVKKFDHVFLKYDWEGCMAVTANNKAKSEMLSAVSDYQSERISNVSATDEALIGCMKDETGKDGFFIVNATDPGKELSNSVTVTFGNATSAICYIQGEESRVKLTNGSYTFDLSAGEGVFVIPVA